MVNISWRTSHLTILLRTLSEASLYIMDDDLDTAESRLSAGSSQFHKV